MENINDHLIMKYENTLNYFFKWPYIHISRVCRIIICIYEIKAQDKKRF